MSTEPFWLGHSEITTLRMCEAELVQSRQQYLELMDISEKLAQRVSDLIGERTDLQRRLAESEASSAALQDDYVDYATTFHNRMDHVGDFLTCQKVVCADARQRLLFGRDFLSAARLCRDALLAVPDGYVDREALAAITRFVA